MSNLYINKGFFATWRMQYVQNMSCLLVSCLDLTFNFVETTIDVEFLKSQFWTPRTARKNACLHFEGQEKEPYMPMAREPDTVCTSKCRHTYDWNAVYCDVKPQWNKH